MNDRLKLIYSLIEPGKGVIDVGTDHGYIPCALAQNGYPGNIIASDINEDPLKSAVKSAKQCGVENRITFMVSDGLMNCDPDTVDTIVIAGLGGDTICSVIDRAEWCMDSRYKLILQPMTKKEILRFWLVNNGFGELKEHIVTDCGKIYQVICTSYTGTNSPYKDAELFTGKIIQNTDLCRQMLSNEKSRAEKRLMGLVAGGAEEYKRFFYGNILDEMNAMKEMLQENG